PVTPEGSRQLRFRFTSDNLGRGGIVADAFLPIELKPPYRWFSADVTGPDGAVTGGLTFDVRLLSGEERAGEQGRAAGWDETARMQFAHALGQQMGHTLIELLEVVAGLPPLAASQAG